MADGNETMAAGSGGAITVAAAAKPAAADGGSGDECINVDDTDVLVDEYVLKGVKHAPDSYQDISMLGLLSHCSAIHTITFMIIANVRHISLPMGRR